MCPPDSSDDDDDPAPPVSDDDAKKRADTAMTVRELVLFAGKQLPPLSTNRILKLGAAAVAPLIEVLVDSSLRDPEGPGAGRGPMHAATLLGRFGASQPPALEPLLDVLATAPPPSELYDALTKALYPFGVALIAPILARLPTAVGSYRQELWTLLANAKVRDPRIFDTLLAALAEQPEEGSMRLAEYGDKAALPYLVRAMDAYNPRLMDDLSDDRVVFELREGIEALGGKLTSSQRRKLEHAQLTRTLERQIRSTHESPLKPNDPCFCRSGRPYKYCCLQ